MTVPLVAWIGSGRLLFLLTVVPLSAEHDEQLLEREEVFDCGEVGLEEVSAGAVLVKDADEAEVVIESVEGTDVRAGLSGKVNRWLVPVADIGLISVGESLERKSRYAAGGVIGVFRPVSSFLMYVGVPGRGLRISDGKPADTGVLSSDSLGFAMAAMMDRSEALRENRGLGNLNRARE